MHAQHQDIRRRPDGSIDIDFYREKGLMERRAVIADVFQRMRFRSALMTGAVVAAALSIIPSRVA